MPRITRAMRLWLTMCLAERSSAVIRGTPYVPADSRWTVRMWAARRASAAARSARSGAVFSPVVVIGPGNSDDLAQPLHAVTAGGRRRTGERFTSASLPRNTWPPCPGCPAPPPAARIRRRSAAFSSSGELAGVAGAAAGDPATDLIVTPGRDR